MSSSTSTATTATAAASAAASGPTLRFFLWDDATETAKDLCYMKILQSLLDTGTIADLRRTMASTPQQKSYALYTFCGNKGSAIPDSWTLKDYLAVSESPTGTGDTTTTTTASVRLLYLRKNVTMTAATTTPTNPVAAPTLDMSLQGSAATTQSAALEAGKSSYQAASHQALADPITLHAADLGEREWAIVTKNNSLLNGYIVDRQKSGTTATFSGIRPARRSAFQYKQRTVPSSVVVSDIVNDTSLSLRVPQFVVDDQSYVTVFETTNTFQASMANSSFSEIDVKASVSGGAFGYSIGVSAGYSASTSDSSASSTMTTANRMNIAYNFPRVTVLLDEDDLEMTDQCKADLALVVDNDSLTKFLNNYGQFFPTRVQLGGRLFASDESSTVAGSSSADKAKSMKAAASVTFGTPWVSGNVSASYGSGSTTASSSSSSNFQSSLSWQANGGDTLLCNNPPAWCPTVASYYNWRLTKQENVLHVLDVISRMPGYYNVPSVVKSMASGTSSSVSFLTDKFYLELVSDATPKLYLSCCTPGVRSTATCLQIMAAYNAIPKSTADAMGARNSSIGGVTARALEVDSILSGQFLEVLDESNNPVTQVKYETKYKFRNPSSGLFLSYTWDSYYCPKAVSDYQPTWFLRNPTAAASARKADTIAANTQISLVTNNSAVDYGLYYSVSAPPTYEFLLDSYTNITAAKLAKFTLKRTLP